VPHLGDPFGRVLAWAWETDQDEAMVLLAGYLAGLRDHHPLAGTVSPRISLEEVLGALRLALPDGFGDYEALTAKARRDVQDYYGPDPDAP
jgi:hypothetical protein